MTKRATIWGVFLLAIIIVGCGVPRGQLRIRGEYQHLDQADFLLYSTDGGLEWVDTLHIRQGEFEFVTALAKNATFHILYPNNDELTIWAHSGDDVVIDGDAQDLLRVKVKGNEENELYTRFRRLVADNDSVPVQNLAAAFIRENPLSPVSVYLLERHFLQCIMPLPQDSVQKLFRVLQKAQPKNNEVALLGGRIQQRYALAVGKTMPDFALRTTDSKTLKLSDYRGKRLLLYFWAGWISSSQGAHSIIADSIAANKNLRAISYSLDVDSLTFQITRADSTVNIPTCCDYQGFQSPLVKQLGITQVPMAVLVNERGKILAADKEISKVLK